MSSDRAVYPGLSGKRVVVTGAGQGIGRATAEAFADAGARVIAVSRSPIDWIKAGGPIEAVCCDIGEPGPLVARIEQLELQGERVDVLVNNAGVLERADLLDCTERQFDEMFAVNVRATFFLAQLIARHMRQRGGGVILNAASYAATLASVSHGVYAASKAAVVSLTRSMAAEWAPYNIRVNAFSPGVIPTRMTSPGLEKRREQLVHAISLQRPGTLDEVTAPILFLASDAASYLTGINLDISGGKLVVQDPASAWLGAPS